MNRRMLVVLAALMFVSSSSYAGWEYGLTLKSVRALGVHGQAAFQTVEQIINPKPCALYEYYGVRPENNPEMALSVLLAAYIAGKKVDIYIEEDQCDVAGRPSITNVRIRD